jgi:hypothetical protein
MTIVASDHRDGTADAQPPGPDAAVEPVRFEGVNCWPDVTKGVPVVAGGHLECGFRLTGPAGRPVTLRCRDVYGYLMDCDQGSPLGYLLAPSSTVLPVDNGVFWMDTEPEDQWSETINWVAEAEPDFAGRSIHVAVIPSGPLPRTPHLDLNCGGDSDGYIEALAGDLVECEFLVFDPQHGSVTWIVEWPTHQDVEHEPEPRWGEGEGGFQWSWLSVAEDGGRDLSFYFYADNESAPVVRYDLLISVH